MKVITEPTLWPKHQLEHPDITRVPEPRMVKPLHIECPDPLGRGVGTVDIMQVSRKELLEHFGFPPSEPNSYKNLQIWLDHQGPALYNPIWWVNTEFPYRHAGRFPHAIGYFADLHGSHRCRALERLQLPYIFVFIHKGPTYCNPTNPGWYLHSNKMNNNDLNPITYTEHGLCEHCGQSIRWEGPPKTGDPKTSGAENFKATLYKCQKCGYIGQRPEVYPEPV